MNYETFFVDQHRRQRDEGRYRVFAELDRIVGAFPRARLHRDGRALREVAVRCSNDFLAMGQHPALTAARHNAIGTRGSGTGGSRNTPVTSALHAELERELTTLHAKEAARDLSSIASNRMDEPLKGHS